MSGRWAIILWGWGIFLVFRGAFGLGGVLGAVGLPGLPWGLGLGGSGGVSRGSHFNFGRVNNP